MAELKIPQKTLQDNFNLQDFKDDFNALNSEIEENKTLTDSEISRLKEIANTWETFRDNGGEINGNINVNNANLNGNLNFSGILNNTDLKTENKKIFDVKRDTGDQIYFGNTSLKMVLDAKEFNVYGAFNCHSGINIPNNSISSTGYTKLPNGIIMQWGQTTLSTSSGGGRVEVTYPISFPNAPLAQTAQVRSCANDYTATRMTALGRAWRSTMTILAQQVSGTIVADGSTCTIDWIAFGH